MVLRGVTVFLLRLRGVAAKPKIHRALKTEKCGEKVLLRKLCKVVDLMVEVRIS